MSDLINARDLNGMSLQFNEFVKMAAAAKEEGWERCAVPRRGRLRDCP